MYSQALTSLVDVFVTSDSDCKKGNFHIYNASLFQMDVK